jgi:hypothetical protein
MEFATGLPMAVGAAALRALNALLDDRRIAIAWYGKDYKKFTSRTWIRGLPGICISHVFSLREEDCRSLIRNSLENSQRWHTARGDGACCWLPIYRHLERQFRESSVIEAQRALSSLGAVSSMPAARVDAWGLVVMAYANGATPSIEKSNGA